MSKGILNIDLSAEPGQDLFKSVKTTSTTCTRPGEELAGVCGELDTDIGAASEVSWLAKRFSFLVNRGQLFDGPGWS